MTSRDVLTQEEVDALLRDVSSGRIETGGGAGFNPEDVKEFDLAAMQSVNRNSKPDIDFLNEVFARHFQSSIRKLLNDQIDVTAGESRLEKFADFLAAQPRPTSLNSANVPQLDAPIMFALDSDLILNYVNLYFGGALGSHIDLERDFTATENGVARKLMAQACSNMGTAWQGVTELLFDSLQTESNPKFCTTFSPAEVLVVSKFEVRIGEEPFGTMELLMPNACLEPLKKRLAASYQGDQQSKRARWASTLEAHLQDTHVELRSVLTTVKVNLRDLVRLRPGDLLPIELPENVELTAGRVALFKGKFGTSNGHNAVHITKRLT